MSIVVIALLHALPVYLLARLTRNRWVLFAAAVGSTALGLYAGRGKYAVYDVLAVLIAAVLAWPLTRRLPEGQGGDVLEGTIKVAVTGVHWFSQG